MRSKHDCSLDLKSLQSTKRVLVCRDVLLYLEDWGGSVDGGERFDEESPLREGPKDTTETLYLLSVRKSRETMTL